VPRHPQRFAEVAELDRRAPADLLPAKRGSRLPSEGTQVWLGDSMGEMAAYYALADLALIGGTLLPFGGQNLIEAAACGCPVLLGPHSFNFAEASEDAIACGAARRVPDAADAAAARCSNTASGDRPQELLGHASLPRAPSARRTAAPRHVPWR
jgi:3-deoxy-D-manno-octulosonic-acid transferase